MTTTAERQASPFILAEVLTATLTPTTPQTKNARPLRDARHSFNRRHSLGDQASTVSEVPSIASASVFAAGAISMRRGLRASGT